MSGKSYIPNILVITEGYTEQIYLRHLRERDSNCTVHVERTHRQTPIKMVKFCWNRFKEKGLKTNLGDAAYCVFDRDNTDVDDLIGAIEYADKRGTR